MKGANRFLAWCSFSVLLCLAGCSEDQFPSVHEEQNPDGGGESPVSCYAFVSKAPVDPGVTLADTADTSIFRHGLDVFSEDTVWLVGFVDPPDAKISDVHWSVLSATDEYRCFDSSGRLQIPILPSTIGWSWFGDYVTYISVQLSLNDDAGRTASSISGVSVAVWRRVVSELGSPSPLLPKYGSVTLDPRDAEVELRWKAVGYSWVDFVTHPLNGAPADSYTVYVSINKTFNEPLATVTGTSLNLKEYLTLSPGTTYYWYVEAFATVTDSLALAAVYRSQPYTVTAVSDTSLFTTVSYTP